MRGAFLLPLLVLVGCDGPRVHTDAEIQDIAEDQAQAQASAVEQKLSARIDDLEGQIREMKSDEAVARANIDTLFKKSTDLAGTVDEHARIANENAVRDMTRRGACGTEAVNYPNGGVVWRNKQCTLKDLN